MRHFRQFYRVNQPSVISEIIDDEAILINLDSGAYYSLREAGVLVWNLIVAGASGDQILEQLSRSYDSPDVELAASLQNLLQELAGENLIVPGAGPESVQVPELPANAAQEKRPWLAFQLEKYTDMAELLLLDPIHEVGQDGWPAPRDSAR